MYEIVTDENCGRCYGSGTWFFAVGEDDYGKDICDCVTFIPAAL